jgi:hypothetical protein
VVLGVPEPVPVPVPVGDCVLEGVAVKVEVVEGVAVRVVVEVPVRLWVGVWVCDVDGVLELDKEIEGVPEGVFEGEGVLRSRLAWKRTYASCWHSPPKIPHICVQQLYSAQSQHVFVQPNHVQIPHPRQLVVRLQPQESLQSQYDDHA